jgi:O-antigen/teichoic acid export membrane protein
MSAFAVNVAGTGLGFAVQVLLARVLGVQGFGIYAYVIAWIGVLSMLATLGFQNVLLRFASAYSATEEWDSLRGLTRYADLRVGLAGVAIGVATAAVVLLSSADLQADLTQTFMVAGVIVPVLALLMVRSSLARAFGLVVIALAPQSALRHATVLVLMGLVAVAAPWLASPQLAMATLLCGTVLGLAVVSIALRRARPAAIGAVQPREKAAEWRRVAIAFLAIAGIQVLIARIGVMMVGWLADTTVAGIYAAAAGIATLAAFTLTAVNVIFAPSIAALHARGDTSALQAMVTMTSRWATAAAVAISLPLLIFAETALWLFGPEFVSGANALRILLIGQIVNAAAGSVGALLGMTGHERQSAAALAAAAIIQVGLNLALVPTFGLVGAATATAVSMTAWNLAFAVMVWRYLGIIPGVFAWR